MAGAPGAFIVFEGGDGAGKTTQAGLLARRMRRRGWPVVLAGSGGEAVRILSCTPAGKRPMAGDAFLRGHQELTGQRLG